MLLSADAREARFQQGLHCPHCAAPDVMRWGRQVGTGAQRYRCRTCRRTFNDTTGTPLARTRRPRLWAAFAECMRLRLSCRAAGAMLGVNAKTAWAWRHRLLAQLAAATSDRLEGIVEADETFLRSNYKRSRPVGRRRRKRGGDGSARGLGRDKVPVLVARSRGGAVRAAVLPAASIAAIADALRDHVSPGATLVTDGSKAMAGAAAALGAHHVGLSTKHGVRRRGLHHIQHVNAHHGRLKQFLAPFRGVATKYLHRYLRWQLFDDQARAMPPARARAVLLRNALPATPHCPTCGGALTTAA